MKKVKITKPQLEAVCEAANTLSAMIGVGSDFDSMAKKIVRLLDNFLRSNGYKRLYK